jgi:hypothetical protein
LGDENSLAGTTKAHKHTSPASDGGFLETAETGVTNMSEASIGYYDSSSILTELPKGTSGQTLIMNTAETAPEWATAGGGVTTNRLKIDGATNGSTYTNTTLGDVTGTSSVALSNEAGGSAFIAYSYTSEHNTNGTALIAIEVGGVDMNYHKDMSADANDIKTMSGCTACVATDGSTVQQRLGVDGGTLTLYNAVPTGYGVTVTDILEVY